MTSVLWTAVKLKEKEQKQIKKNYYAHPPPPKKKVENLKKKKKKCYKKCITHCIFQIPSFERIKILQ